MARRSIAIAAYITVSIALLIVSLARPRTTASIIVASINATNATIIHSILSANSSYYSSRNLSVGEKELYFYQQLPCAQHEITTLDGAPPTSRKSVPAAVTSFVTQKDPIYHQSSECPQIRYIEMLEHYKIETTFTKFFASWHGCHIIIKNFDQGDFTTDASLRLIARRNETQLQLYKEQVDDWLKNNNIDLKDNIISFCRRDGSAYEQERKGFTAIHLLMRELNLF